MHRHFQLGNTHWKHTGLTFLSPEKRHFFLLRCIVDHSKYPKGYEITRYHPPISQRPSVPVAVLVSKCTSLFYNEAITIFVQLQVVRRLFSMQAEFGLPPFVVTDATEKTRSKGTKGQKKKKKTLKLCKQLLGAYVLLVDFAGADTFWAVN